MTEFEGKVAILSELWITNRNVKEWADFFDYNDIALPLAFLIDQKIVESSEVGIRYIEETWELLMDTLEIEDIGFETLDNLLEETEEDDV